MCGDEATEHDPITIIRDALQVRYLARDWRRWNRSTFALTQALRLLDFNQACALAREIWGGYPHDNVAYFLAQLNATVPGALVDLYHELLKERMFRPGWLYLGAPAAVTAQLLRLIDGAPSTHDVNNLLLSLAWAGDHQVQDAFHHWRADPPSWQSDLHIPPYDYAVEAGWELTPEGSRRQLYHDDCYELRFEAIDRLASLPITSSSARPAPSNATCAWCGRQLAMLLDIDLRDPRSSFLTDALRFSDAYLRILHCPWCSAFATIYTDIGLQGDVVWSAENGNKPAILEQVGPGADDMRLSPPGPLVLGARRRTPFEALGRFMLDETGISQLGGHPEWVNDANYPVCPGCARRMEFIGQVAWERVEERADGVTYAFACFPCGKSATTYQQS